MSAGPDMAWAEKVFKAVAKGRDTTDKAGLIAAHGNVDYGLFDKLDKNKDGQVDSKEW